MRISTSTVNNSMINASSNNYQTYINLINKIASGKNFTKVSENVVDATKILKMDDQIAKLNEYQSNINAASNEMSLSFTTLGSITDELTNINTLIVEAANASTTTDSAKAIAEDVKQKVASIVSLMNTKYLDNYIFSGTNTQTRPYEEDGNGSYIYNGSNAESGDRNLTISEGKTMAYNVTGDNVFKTTTTTTQDEDGNEITTEKNFFSEMNDLNALLNADTLDYDAIRAKIGVIQDTQKSVSLAQGEISAKVSKLDTTKSLNDSTLTSLAIDKSGIEEIDIAKAASELANAQSALQASYALSSRIMQGVSLLNYI